MRYSAALVFLSVAALNNCLIIRLSTSLFKSPILHQGLLLWSSILLSSIFHLCLCISFLAMVISIARLFDYAPIVTRKMAVVALFEAHLPLAVWACLTTVLLSGYIEPVQSPPELCLRGFDHYDQSASGLCWHNYGLRLGYASDSQCRPRLLRYVRSFQRSSSFPSWPAS